MVLTLLFWLVTTPVVLPIGWVVAEKSGLFSQKDPEFNGYEALFVAFITGVIVQTVLCLWLSLFVPMDVWVFGVLCAASLGAVLYQRLQKDSGFQLGSLKLDFWSALLLFAGFVISLVFSVSLEKDNGMNSIYHLQTLRWNAEYAVVPGLGNLNSRLGYNHSYLLLEAALAAPFSRWAICDDLNGLLLFFFCFYLVGNPNKTASIGRRAAVLLLPIGFIFIATSTPELWVAIAIFFVVSQLWEAPDAKLDFKQALFLCIVVAFTVTVKLSALSLGVFALMALWMGRGELTRLHFLRALALIGLLVTPWLIRFYLLTGYLIYPLYQFDFFQPDWKMPIAIPKYEQYINTYVARTSGFSPQDDWNIEGKGFWYWFTPWIRGKSIGYLAALSLFLFVAMMAVTAFFKKGTLLNCRLSVLFLITLAIGFWFWQSPNMRYVIGYAWICVVIAWDLFAARFPILNKRLKLLPVFLAGLAIFYIATKNYQSNLITQAPYHQPKLGQKAIKGGIVSYPIKPEIGCWDATLPCTDTLFAGLEFRGKNLREGFRINRGQTLIIQP